MASFAASMATGMVSRSSAFVVECCDVPVVFCVFVSWYEQAIRQDGSMVYQPVSRQSNLRTGGVPVGGSPLLQGKIF